MADNAAQKIVYRDDIPVEQQGGLRPTSTRRIGPLRWYIGPEEKWARLGPLLISWNTDTATKRFRRLAAYKTALQELSHADPV